MSTETFYVSVETGNSGTKILCLPQDITSAKKIKDLNRKRRVYLLNHDGTTQLSGFLGCIRNVEKIPSRQDALNVLNGVGVG